MRYIVQILIFISFVPLKAKPPYDLLEEYVETYRSVIDDSKTIADSVQAEYSETFFAMDDDNIIAVLGRNEVKDTILNGIRIWIRKDDYSVEDTFQKFEYDTLRFLMDTIEMMIETSIPKIDFYSKSTKIKRNLLKTEGFEDKVQIFNEYFETLVEIAAVIRRKNPEFLRRQYQEDFETADDLESFQKWFDVVLEIQDLEIEESLRKFEIRYGENSEKINLVELVIINHLPPFKGNMSCPSPWEPILRFTPVCYNFSDNRFVKTFQIGMNYYFFEDGFFKLLHHIGIAFLLADIESEKIYQWSTLSFGAQVHLGKFQFGIVKDRTDDTWKFISTIDFQIIPLLF